MAALKRKKSAFKAKNPILRWDDSMSVGVKALDDDHKKIIAMINKLFAAVERGESDSALDNIFYELFHYIGDHVAREESLLQRTNYPDCLAHEQEHAACQKELESVFAKFLAKEDRFISIEVMTMLCLWWKKHILQTDMLYKEHMAAHGIK